MTLKVMFTFVTAVKMFFLHVSFSHLPDLGLNLTAEVEGSWTIGGNPTEWGWREFKLPRRPLVTCFLSLFGSSVIHLVGCLCVSTYFRLAVCNSRLPSLLSTLYWLVIRIPTSTWSGVQGVNWGGQTRWHWFFSNTWVKSVVALLGWVLAQHKRTVGMAFLLCRDWDTFAIVPLAFVQQFRKPPPPPEVNAELV